MRKVNFKTLIATSLIMLALMVVGIGRGQAQNSMGSGGTGIYSFPAKVTFVGATQAENILNAHITILQNYVVTLPVASPAWYTTQRSIMYYRTILAGVIDGKAVNQSVMGGINLFLTDLFATASYTEKLNLRQESIGMLSTVNVPNNNTY